MAVQTEAYRDIAEGKVFEFVKQLFHVIKKSVSNFFYSFSDDGVIVECQGDIESAAKFYENHSQQSAEPEDEDNYSDTVIFFSSLSYLISSQSSLVLVSGQWNCFSCPVTEKEAQYSFRKNY